MGKPMTVHIETTSPERFFLLDVDETVSLEGVADHSDRESHSGRDDAGGRAAKIVLPAEALLRLVAGRMDDEHLPAVLSVTGVSLDELRAVFPGF
jgi:hypothetical protein